MNVVIYEKVYLKVIVGKMMNVTLKKVEGMSSGAHFLWKANHSQEPPNDGL